MALFGDEQRFLDVEKNHPFTQPNIGPGTYYSKDNEMIRLGWKPESLKYCKREPMSPSTYRRRPTSPVYKDSYLFGTADIPGPGHYNTITSFTSSFEKSPSSTHSSAIFASNTKRLHPDTIGTLGNGYIIKKREENFLGPGQYSLPQFGSSKSFNMRAIHQNQLRDPPNRTASATSLSSQRLSQSSTPTSTPGKKHSLQSHKQREKERERPSTSHSSFSRSPSSTPGSTPKKLGAQTFTTSLPAMKNPTDTTKNGYNGNNSGHNYYSGDAGQENARKEKDREREAGERGKKKRPVSANVTTRRFSK
mmetsp:Transcript_28230/g.28518  ORF Transcript_28230/g.28518 Transcript_28230/m.28518 type:complete len:306 (+) Transcript_28230:712-1629(+)|eukprot:CAMPEP_0182417074 /NCGR_PEP_ID=MMETSP1167-20130531/1492_1 /TAXON_ID=2988 /ORGANISM="Mallomonas Sp, Strain CCMP3275" /LENGTH=305 /DNA_ID=CAMNT_0024590359 /DNA_START=707 /DNA_END=1624 /DNA_ORIENTATION=-